MNKESKIRAVKYALYALLLLLLYLLQTVPGLFVLFGTKPVWLISAAVAIAMIEGEFIGGIFGAAAGLLCDIGGAGLFGYNGFFIALCCIGAGLLVIYLMHCNVWGCLLFTAAAMLITRSLEYIFLFGMWGHENVWKIYLYEILPLIVYSTAIAPLPYMLVKLIHRKAGAALG